MATTVPGGRYLDAQGNWKDAHGNRIDSPSSEGPSSEAVSEGDLGDPLPEDFPARDLLTEAGYASVEDVAAASREELRAVKGIGPATADKIRAATNGG